MRCWFLLHPGAARMGEQQIGEQRALGVLEDEPTGNAGMLTCGLGGAS